MNILIRDYCKEDFQEVLAIWNQIIEDQDGFLWDKTFPKGKLEYVISAQEAVMCAVDSDSLDIIGFYIVHPNNSGKGAHIANALFAVKNTCRGSGVGRLLGQNCIIKAKELGYEAIQFNSVISSNIPSNKLWESLNFKKIGTVPNGYKFGLEEYRDLFIYYLELV